MITEELEKALKELKESDQDKHDEMFKEKKVIEKDILMLTIKIKTLLTAHHNTSIYKQLMVKEEKIRGLLLQSIKGFDKKNELNIIIKEIQDLLDKVIA